MTAFCSDLSRAAGEPLPGTGAHPARMLLLRWPKGSWDARIFAARGMTPALEAALDGVRADRRVQIVDRKGEAAGRHRLFLYPEGITQEVATADLPAVVASVAEGDLAGWAPAPRPVMLVCTHGVKDRCCARHGFTAYRDMARSAKDVDVWESTHLGGCRLAASALSLPAMYKYGRLRAGDADGLLAAERDGRPWRPRWRGPTHLPPEAQAVAVAAAEWAAEADETTQGDPQRGSNAWTVRLASGGHLVARTSPRHHARPSTCDDLDAGKAGEGISWQVTLTRANDPAGGGAGRP